MARIAFIGLGHMGGGMAPNLVKAGHEVRAFDLSEEALAHAVEGGCIRAGSTEARGVFFRLNTLKAGDDVFVKRADGTTAEFRVTEVQTYLKDHFPTQTVYGPTPDAELRLITCGGAFDSVSRHYLSNIVVYATQVR